jgi:asparagine synthase (glutamine-hydrolysing)
LNYEEEEKNEEEKFRCIMKNYEDPSQLINFKGQFAFAMFDQSRQCLLLIRDQIGVVPLYYMVDADRVIFGTAIKPILADLGKHVSVNEDIIHEYFMFRYVSGENTFFKNVIEVKPGSIVQINGEGRLTKEDYYDLQYSENANDRGLSANELFEKAFWESLSRRTSDNAERRIGVLSSGGVDSSILVSCYHRLLGSRFSTYYVGFEEYEGNRIKEVNYLGELCNTNHNNVLISNKEYSDNLIETIRINEEPLSHPCTVALKCLYQHLQGHVDTLLSGEGADCLYCGYYIFNLMNWFYIKNPARCISGSFANLLPINLVPFSYRSKIDRVIKALTCSAAEYATYYGDYTYNTRKGVDELLTRDFPDRFAENYASAFLGGTKENVLDIVLNIYQTHYLIEGLRTGDKLGCAYNIELRYPFVDLDMINVFNHLPWRKRIDMLGRKRQVIALGKKYLPRGILKKPKEGFGVPLPKWFYEEKGLGRFMALLTENRTRERGIFNAKYLDKLLSDYENKSLNHAAFESIIWPIINFELWNRIFIDKNMRGY